MPSSYRKVLSREHERTRRRLLQVRSELAMLDQGGLWHPLTEDEYRDLLFAELEEPKATDGGIGIGSAVGNSGAAKDPRVPISNA